MDKKFDYSEFDLGKLTYQFAELTPAEADDKRALYEQFVQEKEAAKLTQAAATVTSATNDVEASPVAAKKPVFRPTAKPVSVPTPPPDPTVNSTDGAIAHPLTDATPDEMQQIAQGGLETAKKPVFRPTQKPLTPAVAGPETPAPLTTPESAEPELIAPKSKSAFRPTMKPASTDKPNNPTPTNEAPATDVQSEAPPKPKPAFRPTMRPKPGSDESASS